MCVCVYVCVCVCSWGGVKNLPVISQNKDCEEKKCARIAKA